MLISPSPPPPCPPDVLSASSKSPRHDEGDADRLQGEQTGDVVLHQEVSFGGVSGKPGNVEGTIQSLVDFRYQDRARRDNRKLPCPTWFRRFRQHSSK